MGLRERMKWRRHTMVGTIILLALGSIAFAVHRKNLSDLTTGRYVLGMRALKGEGALKNLEVAEKLFTEVAAEGDARGDFGLACVMYQRRNDGHPTPVWTKTKMEYAATHGSATAQAALLSYYARGYGTPVNLSEANRLLLEVLEAARDSAFVNPIDPALPAISAKHPVARNSPEFVWEILKQNLCAPALFNEDIESVIKKEPVVNYNQVIKIPNPVEILDP
jgi:hypothetical protein